MNGDVFWEEEDYDEQDRAMEAQERAAKLYDQADEYRDPRILYIEAGPNAVPKESIGDLLNLSIWETQFKRANYYDWFLDTVRS